MKTLFMRENWGKANRRRSGAIHAYVGANGGGKSLAMVHDTLPSLINGRPCLSTVRLLDFERPRACDTDCDDPETHDLAGVIHRQAHPLYTPLKDFRQLLDWTGGDVLMDEVTGVASSRESHAIPVQVVNFLVQLRRRDVLLRWSAPNWSRADKVIREVSQAVTDCSGMFATYRVQADGSARLWRDRRLFRWATYDAFAFDEFSAHKRDTCRPTTRQFFWRPGSISERAYDTLDPVLALGAATEAGMCMTCGGKRSMPRCRCVGDDVEAMPVTRSRAARQGSRLRRSPASAKREDVDVAGVHGGVPSTLAESA